MSSKVTDDTRASKPVDLILGMKTSRQAIHYFTHSSRYCVLTCSEVFMELMMLGRLMERVASDFDRGRKESSSEDFLLGESVGAGEGGVGAPDCFTMSSPDFRRCLLPDGGGR